MLYSGIADWDAIRAVREAVRIPVVANGDVFDAEAALSGNEIPPLPPLARRMDTAMHQFELAREDKGDHIACLEARKHFAWYLRGVAHSSYYKEKISSISTPEDVEAIAKGIRRDLQ